MSKKALLIWVILVLMGIFYLKWGVTPSLRLIMCDVGQGDAYILSYKSFQMVIDGGPNRKILECLSSSMPIFDKEIEMVVATHPDKDHIAGLQHVLTRYKVDQIITNGQKKATSTYTAFRQAIDDQHIPEKVAKSGDSYAIDGVVLDVLWPEVEGAGSEKAKSGENNDLSAQNGTSTVTKNDDANASSVVFRLEFGGFSALFTGDLESDQEQQLVTSGVLEETTLLKVGHHGSKHSTSAAFLEVIRPKVAFIGVGTKNTYGHPANSVLQLLEENRVKIYRTDRDGQVILETDGKSFWKI